MSEDGRGLSFRFGSGADTRDTLPIFQAVSCYANVGDWHRPSPGTVV
mgnify:CR=1 FL=1